MQETYAIKDPTAPNLLGIDPGSSSGALVLFTAVGKAVTTYNMPATLLDIYTLLKNINTQSESNITAVIENVGGTRPGNAAKSARTFAEHIGALKMALLALGIKSIPVMPRKWMVAVAGPGVPTGSTSAQVKARKDYIYAAMQRLYPTVSFTKRQSDAIGLMHYGRLLQADGKIV